MKCASCHTAEAIVQDYCRDCLREADQCIECFRRYRRCMTCSRRLLRTLAPIGSAEGDYSGEPIDRMAQLRTEDRAAIRSYETWRGSV